VVGALLWGDAQHLNLSLDRGDVWDLRAQGLTKSMPWTYSNLVRLVHDKDYAEVEHLFESVYEHPNPTKLPGFRLEIELGADVEVEAFSLDLETGVGGFRGTRTKGTVVVRRDDPVAVGRIETAVRSLKLQGSAAVGQLGFPSPQVRQMPDGWLVEQGTDGQLIYAAFVASKSVEGVTEFAVAYATNAHNADAAHEAERIARHALKLGYADAEAKVIEWWAAFWKASGVRVPDRAIQRQYDFAMYLYGAGSKRGAPPLTLQGLWTADNGGLPPWKGDYHNDLNIQLTYWPYLAAGHWDEGESLFDYLWQLRPEFRRFAADFYGTPGLAIPGVFGLDGEPLGGWAMYSLSPTMGPWLATAFMDHWRVTRDERFLRDRAYPFCKEMADFVRHVLHPGDDGLMRLLLSSSPEIHDNSPQAWLVPNSNFDLSVLKAFYRGLSEMATEMGNTDDLAEWKGMSSHLEELHVNPVTGVLRVDAKEDLVESHRHFSHLVSIHPFGLISVDGGASEVGLIDKSLDALKPLGTREWCGYSFAWMANLAARAGRAADALKNLRIYAKAFVLRNGFHCNGDQSGKGYSGFTYRPVTLEGNFAAAQAVHEMVLQSWGGVVRIFPACAWDEASFEGLRAEGGFVVSAVRSGGKTKHVEIVATKTGDLRLRVDSSLRWQTAAGAKTGAEITCHLKPGEHVVGIG
jgi:alpha-L-fucosidase 2